MAKYPMFDELRFLADLQAALKAVASLDPLLENSQIRLLDRDPTEEDLYTLAPGTLLLLPGQHEPVHYGDALTRIEPYPVHVLIFAQTFDASEEADRWTDDTVGGARLRQKAAEALVNLGPAGDGVFTLSAAGHRLNFVTLGPMDRPARLMIGEGEDGVDISVPAITALYDLEIEAA